MNNKKSKRKAVKAARRINRPHKRKRSRAERHAHPNREARVKEQLPHMMRNKARIMARRIVSDFRKFGQASQAAKSSFANFALWRGGCRY